MCRRVLHRYVKAGDEMRKRFERELSKKTKLGSEECSNETNECNENTDPKSGAPVGSCCTCTATRHNHVVV